MPSPTIETSARSIRTTHQKCAIFAPITAPNSQHSPFNSPLLSHLTTNLPVRSRPTLHIRPLFRVYITRPFSLASLRQSHQPIPLYSTHPLTTPLTSLLLSPHYSSHYFSNTPLNLLNSSRWLARVNNPPQTPLASALALQAPASVPDAPKPALAETTTLPRPRRTASAKPKVKSVPVARIARLAIAAKLARPSNHTQAALLSWKAERNYNRLLSPRSMLITALLE